MKIVVGFIDSPEGDAAIDKAVEEAKLRNGSLVVVHSKIGGRHDKAEDYVAMANALD
ncbi:MAG TPA: universal stress protein, partial [Actinobacteria bacterium]|nr:universal stress protein [Actinomycetota bacterium]